MFILQNFKKPTTNLSYKQMKAGGSSITGFSQFRTLTS